MKVAALGAGSWGTALSILLARNGHEVDLYGREEMEVLRARRENLRYLPGFAVPLGVNFFDMDAPLNDPDMTIVAIPSGGVRSVLTATQGAPGVVVMASKGLELGTGAMLTDVAAEVWPDATVGALSGPNLAVEIVRGIPTASVAAFSDVAAAEMVQRAFLCATFRVYVNPDVVGVELAGALKNVLAIGAGMSDALGYGDNTKGSLLARGLGEMTALGVAMGARVETFMGIAGVGDLFATAVSTLSRNYRVGRAIGEGKSLTDAQREIDQVAEGVPTSEAVVALARKHNVQMPVFEMVESVLRGRVQPRHAVTMLMERMPKAELPV